MTPWLDTHCHLDDPDEPTGRLHDALDRLVDAGWPGALTAGYGPERLTRSREIADRWPVVKRAVGMHPEYLARLATDGEREAARLAMLAELKHPSVIALGEIGLDRRYKDVWPLQAQIAYLEEGLRVAHTHGLPVVLHLVGWYGHALEVLKRVGVQFGGAVHRWSGPLELVPAFESLGLGIALALEPRFEPARRQALARTIAPDHLLLETDWPFLALDYREAVHAMTALGHEVATWRGEDPALLQNRLAANARTHYHLAP